MSETRRRKRKSKKQKRSRVGMTAKKPAQAKRHARRKAATASPTPARRPVDDLVDAGTLALGLRLDPDQRAGVTANLDLILRQASLLMDFPLPDECEPAPIFRA
jgi:hypothetical protein